MVKIFHNSLGSGDWIHIKDGDLTIFEGHRVTVRDLAHLLERYANVRVFDLTDEQMEDGLE